jgi:SHS2 domain-containing protein
VPAPGYTLLPHTTDAYIQATGSTLEEALEFAGMALFDTMCDLKSISTEHVENVKVTAPDEVTLLYNWLESLLLKFELEHKVFSKFKVKLDRELSNRIQAIAKVYGETYERRKHGAKVEVKAVTLHKIEVVHSDDAAIVRFILDL